MESPNPHDMPSPTYFEKKARGAYHPTENPLGFRSADYTRKNEEKYRNVWKDENYDYPLSWAFSLPLR